jgi:hypothetical protein
MTRMPQTGQLDLTFVDVDGNAIGDTVDISLRHNSLPEERRVRGHDGRQPISIGELRSEPQGLYRLEIRPTVYRPVQRFVTILSSGPTRQAILLPIDPDHAKPVFPTFDQLDDRLKGVLTRSSKVKGFEGITGESLYQKLDDVAKAGLLNIAKKSLVTPFKDGADLLPHLALLEIKGDRCFVEVPGSLSKQVSTPTDTNLFRPVNGTLHEPPQGFQHDGSFKTADAFGNLQLTFFRSGDQCVADVDIDDAAGLGHVFQVLRNHLKGNPTHPYNIHEILIAHQHLDPGYRLMPKVS